MRSWSFGLRSWLLSAGARSPVLGLCPVVSAVVRAPVVGGGAFAMAFLGRIGRHTFALKSPLAPEGVTRLPKWRGAAPLLMPSAGPRNAQER